MLIIYIVITLCLTFYVRWRSSFSLFPNMCIKPIKEQTNLLYFACKDFLCS